MTKPKIKGFFDQATATWTYLVWSDINKNCAVIDSVLDYDPSSSKTSTASADLIINFIKEKDLKLQWILETHIHADHLTGAQYLKKKLGGKTAISKHILKVLATWKSIKPESTWTLDGKQFDHLFEDNENFKIGEIDACIIHTPGHTPADTSYLIGEAIFVGDAMFLPDVGSGRCDFPGGSASDSYDSIQKILSLPNNYLIHVGHDYPPANSGRGPQSVVTVAEQKTKNIRFHDGISKEEFINKRQQDDIGKAPPKLLIPSIEANLHAGKFS